VLAEASVIYAGIIRMPVGRFFALTCAANLLVAGGFGLAVYYGLAAG
jgi:membrane protein DedA with SNARE-associated domain